MCDRNSDRDILRERDRILSSCAGTAAVPRETGGPLGPIYTERDQCAKQAQNCETASVPQTYRELRQRRNVLLREQEALSLKLTIIDQMLSVF